MADNATFVSRFGARVRALPFSGKACVERALLLMLEKDWHWVTGDELLKLALRPYEDLVSCLHEKLTWNLLHASELFWEMRKKVPALKDSPKKRRKAKGRKKRG